MNDNLLSELMAANAEISTLKERVHSQAKIIAAQAKELENLKRPELAASQKKGYRSTIKGLEATIEAKQRQVLDLEAKLHGKKVARKKKPRGSRMSRMLSHVMAGVDRSAWNDNPGE